MRVDQDDCVHWWVEPRNLACDPRPIKDRGLDADGNVCRPAMPIAKCKHCGRWYHEVHQPRSRP